MSLELVDSIIFSHVPNRLFVLFSQSLRLSVSTTKQRYRCFVVSTADEKKKQAAVPKLKPETNKHIKPLRTLATFNAVNILKLNVRFRNKRIAEQCLVSETAGAKDQSFERCNGTKT